MKTLKDKLNEGVLTDIETTMKEIDKGAFAKMYPIPTKSDFYYTDIHWKESHCSWGVDWNCKDYIKQIVDEFPNIRNFHTYEIEGLTGRVTYSEDREYCLSIAAYTKIHNTRQLLSIIHIWGMAELPSKGKAMILKMFKHLLNNPNAMKYVFDWHVKHMKDNNPNSDRPYDELQFDEVLKIK